MPHLHLDRRGQRQATAGARDQLPLLGGQVAAADIRDVRTHELGQREQQVVQGDGRADLTRHLPVLGIERRGQGERQQLVVGVEVLLAQAPDILRVLSRLT